MRILVRFLAAVVALPLLSNTKLIADDMSACKQNDEIVKELREIRKLLENQAADQKTIQSRQQSPVRAVKFDVTKSPFLGSTKAPLAIVQFTGFQCPYCNRFFTDAFPGLKKNYIETGKVRFYSVDLPLRIHPNASRAAQAAQCAA